MTRILMIMRSRESFLLWFLTFSIFLLFERTGLFRFEPASYREIFHALPARILSVLLFLCALSGIAGFIGQKDMPRRAGSGLFYLSVIFLAAGIWISYYTHFSGKVIKPEGTPFNGFPMEYIRPTVYRAKYAKPPEVGILPNKIDLSTSTDSMKLQHVTIDINYAGRTTGGILKGTLRSDWPLFSDWTLVWVSDFGYMPRYALHDHKEILMEQDYVPLKLYPPGTEDSVRTQFLGYLFYLTLYPDFEERDGRPATKSAELRNPVYNLRVVRNKDIIYSGLMKPSEKLKFDDVVISFPEVKPWIEMTLVRDFGIPVAVAGILLLCISIVLQARGKP